MKRIKNCTKNETVTFCRTVATLIHAGAGLCAHLVVLLTLGLASFPALAEGLPLKTCPGQEGQFYLCSGDIIVADTNAGPAIAWKGSSSALLLIDSVSGARAIISQGGFLQETAGVVVEDTGNIVATDRISGVIRINPASGEQTVLSAADPLLNDYFGITKNADGDFIVTDTGWDPTTAFPGRAPLNQSGRVLLIDKTSGAVSVLAQGGPIAHPFGVAVDPVTASIVISDMGASNSQGGIFRLSSQGGEPTLLLGPSGREAGVGVQNARVNCPTGVAVDATEDIPANVVDLSFNACGSANVEGIVVNGQGIVVRSSQDQTRALRRGRLVNLNAENDSVPDRNASITVTALHVTAAEVTDTVITSGFGVVGGVVPPFAVMRPRIGITGGGGGGGGGGGTASGCVTGGGWINTSASINGVPLPPAKKTFGVGGGVRHGAFEGHLEYQDHGIGLNVHGTSVTAYTATGLTSRHIEGHADVNGQSGFTYAVDVADNGEPGRNDTFAIQVSNGYVSGEADTKLSGGNIQLHINHACR